MAGATKKGMSMAPTHRKWDKVFDLSSFNFTRTNQDLFKNAYQMMDVKQLYDAIDSFKRSRKNAGNILSSYIAPYVTLENRTKEDTQLTKNLQKNTGPARGYKASFLERVPTYKRLTVIQTTTNNLRNTRSYVDNNCLTEELQKENNLKYSIELHRKFALSTACFLLFLIGAPIGAIIRKGGLGLPLVFAVSFFITFHILNITGEKLAKAGTLPPWGGMWMSTLLMLPIGIWLIVTARNDSQVFSKELYLRLWRRVAGMVAFQQKKRLIVDQKDKADI